MGFIAVSPQEGKTKIDAPGEVIEGHLAVFTCKVDDIRPVNKVNVKWKIGRGGEEKNSTNLRSDENPNGLFWAIAELSDTFVEDNNDDDITCRVYWEDSYHLEVSHTMTIFCKYKKYPLQKYMLNII